MSREEPLIIENCPDIPKKEKPGTVRVLKLEPGMLLLVAGKYYQVIRVRQDRVFAKFIGEENELNI